MWHNQRATGEDSLLCQLANAYHHDSSAFVYIPIRSRRGSDSRDCAKRNSATHMLRLG